jgi:DNA-binding transcriptional regulator GbsR (MarR family)
MPLQDHFGEMGSRWGINRTVGQIYALIFVSPAR